jgi:hypothetical protein
MRPRRIRRFWRHPVITFGAAVFFFLAGMVAFCRVIDDSHVLASGDPMRRIGWVLRHEVSRHDFEREIRSTLVEGKVELAQDILNQAMRENLLIDPSLIDSVREAYTNQGSNNVRIARTFAAGLLTGEASDAESLVGAMAGDALFLGDVRDLGLSGFYCLSGKDCDWLTLALASGGLVATLAGYTTMGAAAPGRIGISFLKAARRFLNPRLAQRLATIAIKDGPTLLALASDLRTIETNAGAEAVLDSLAFAEAPEDIALLARLAVAKGREMRVALRLLKRELSQVGKKVEDDIARSLCWLIFAFFGLAASLKATVERMASRGSGLTKPA